jgi:hypothetical protein
VAQVGRPQPRDCVGGRHGHDPTPLHVLPAAFFLLFTRPRVALDGGEPQKVNWREPTELSVTPGTHRLHVSYPYLMPRVAGNADLEVSVPEGQTVDVGYRAPVISFSPGKLRLNAG